MIKKLFDTSRYRILLLFVFLFIRFGQSIDNGVGLTPPMGWNGWNYLQCNINEDIVKKTADLLVETGLAKKGYKYVNLDDCWQMSRDHATNKIIADPVRFKSGMASLGKYIHGKGLKFGLYSDSGFLTCEKRPGSYGFQDIDAQTYAQWEVDFLKYDSCYAGPQPGVMRHSRMARALNKTGRPIFFSICDGADTNAFAWQRYVGNSWRTTYDIEDKWDSFVKTLDQQMGNEIYAGPGSWNDPDMLQVGNGGMTVNEYQAHFALWCALKAPLLIGCDLSKASKQILQILGNEQMIAVNQDSLGIQARRVKRTTYDNQIIDIYGGWLSNNRYIVIFFNRGWYNAGTQISLKKQLQLMYTSYTQRDPLRYEDIKQSTDDLLRMPIIGNHSVEVRILKFKNQQQQEKYQQLQPQLNLERQNYIDILPRYD